MAHVYYHLTLGKSFPLWGYFYLLLYENRASKFPDLSPFSIYLHIYKNMLFIILNLLKKFNQALKNYSQNHGHICISLAI